MLAIFTSIFIVCQDKRKKKKKRSHNGLSVAACHFQACHFSTCCKFVRQTERCCWIWGRTQRALSESLVITGASLFTTANKIALFVAFFMATRKNVFIFQVCLVWLHTSQHHAGSTLQCDDCFVCLCTKKKKKRSPTSKKATYNYLSGRPTERWEANQPQVQKEQYRKSWSNTDHT